MNGNMSFGMFLGLFGALLAYLIGAGMASGQEAMQYFTAWGSIPAMLTVMVVNFIVMFCTFMAYTYAGRKGAVDLRRSASTTSAKRSACSSRRSPGYSTPAAICS